MRNDVQYYRYLGKVETDLVRQPQQPGSVPVRTLLAARHVERAHIRKESKRVGRE